MRSFYRQNHPFLNSFTVASEGGDVSEAIKIGLLFRKYLLTAFAPRRITSPRGSETFITLGEHCVNCVCASACALIWFAAVERNGTVGLHRPRTDDPDFKRLDPPAAAAAYRRVLNGIREYLDQMEVPMPMIEAMVATGSADIKWVNADDDLERPPSLAEWEDASCGRVSVNDQNLLADLLARGSDLNEKEQNLRDQLHSKHSQWSRCKIELLSSSRDRLGPP